ncbi:tripartite tricarboxylate transporter substrate binding protein [Variovorax sp. WS11]|uniref:tripartite tricarboxylate transporter substrate binding protein n=1 Tax=Variovorax sp. WS11 TaxID=1105204 RepID=UPI000D0CB265|nr:tripartite tricarboxylate transporter substrate binding protein [Variovorax sp. WS11]NDZ16507.1 tripartite tricarboxylate transporter substrate binding protein [Variovorax sp. WS11]PSL85916.1 tripartite tricarboxylate transporter substrate binding protein [Variovorax sp. WS11]
MSVPSPSHPRRRLLRLGASLALAVAALPAAQAADWPSADKPVRIVVGFPPGGGADVLARVISTGLAAEIGGNVIVENRPGAGGLLATEAVARAPADGYTLYIATPGSFTIWPSLRKLKYDASKDFAAVSLLVTMPNLLVTGAATPYDSVAGLIAAARAPGARLNYASGGVGTIGQIAAEQFNVLAGLNLSHVPYKGTAPALTDVMGGMVPITFSDPSAKSQIDGGKLKLLAVTTAKRSRLFPDTPTMAESGVAGYDVMNWYGLVAPAGTPPAVVSKLNAGLVKVMAQADVRQRLEAAGMEATSSSPRQFGELMSRERSKWAALIAKAGIQAD